MNFPFHCFIVDINKLFLNKYNYPGCFYHEFQINFWKSIFQMMPFYDEHLFESIEKFQLLTMSNNLESCYYRHCVILLIFCLQQTPIKCPAFCIYLIIMINFKFYHGGDYTFTLFEKSVCYIDKVLNKLNYDFNSFDKYMIDVCQIFIELSLTLNKDRFFFQMIRDDQLQYLLFYYHKRKNIIINHMKLYLLWLISTPNKDCYLYLLPTDISRMIIKYVV